MSLARQLRDHTTRLGRGVAKWEARRALDVAAAGAIREIRLPNLQRARDSRLRLNLLIPGLKPQHIYGGAAVALQFFQRAARAFPQARIIVTDSIAPATTFQGLPVTSLGFRRER